MTKLFTNYVRKLSSFIAVFISEDRIKIRCVLEEVSEETGRQQFCFILFRVLKIKGLDEVRHLLRFPNLCTYYYYYLLLLVYTILTFHGK